MKHKKDEFKSLVIEGCQMHLIGVGLIAPNFAGESVENLKGLVAALALLSIRLLLSADVAESLVLNMGSYPKDFYEKLEVATSEEPFGSSLFSSAKAFNAKFFPSDRENSEPKASGKSC